MNMALRQRDYVRGEMVGMVDLDKVLGPMAVPMTPARWYILRVFPNREFKVLKAFNQRNISAWLPINTSRQTVTKYRRGYQFNVQQLVTSPLVTGCLILPDFEAASGRWRAVDGIIGIHRMGPCVPVLTPALYAQLRMIEAIGNTPKTKRDHKFAIGELVRVTSGPFALFCGRVERFDSPGRLSVGVDIFGRITPIEIEESDVEAVDTAQVVQRLGKGRKRSWRRP